VRVVGSVGETVIAGRSASALAAAAPSDLRAFVPPW
jgi:hypothetical protein